MSHVENPFTSSVWYRGMQIFSLSQALTQCDRIRLQSICRYNRESFFLRSLLSQFHFRMWCQRNSLRFYYKFEENFTYDLLWLASKWNRLRRFTQSLSYVIIVSNFQHYNMWRYFLRTFHMLHSIWHGNYTENVINFQSMEFLAIPFGISLTNDDESNRLCILNFRAQSEIFFVLSLIDKYVWAPHEWIL